MSARYYSNRLDRLLSMTMKMKRKSIGGKDVCDASHLCQMLRARILMENINKLMRLLFACSHIASWPVSLHCTDLNVHWPANFCPALVCETKKKMSDSEVVIVMCLFRVEIKEARAN